MDEPVTERNHENDFEKDGNRNLDLRRARRYFRSAGLNKAIVAVGQQGRGVQRVSISGRIMPREPSMPLGWSVLVCREGLLLGWPVEWPRVQLCRLGRLRGPQRHRLHARDCDHRRGRHHVQLPIELFD